MRRLLFLGLVLAAVLAALIWAGEAGWGPVVITHEGEQKLVLLLGDPTSVQTEPGLSFRIPLLTDVRVFDSRLLYLNTDAMSTRTRDEERIIVDNYVMWRITDPLQFYASFPTGMTGARERIDTVVEAELRGAIGQRSLAEVVTDARVSIMDEVTGRAAKSVADYGIEIRAVRINRTELPAETEQNVYARMRTERERLARKYRAEGEEEGRLLRADADRQARVIVAEANRDSEILRGEGEAEAARVYAEAHSTAPEFYGFQRRLEAYRKTIGKQTTLVLPPENDFFSLFATPPDGALAGSTAPPAPRQPGPGAAAASAPSGSGE